MSVALRSFMVDWNLSGFDTAGLMIIGTNEPGYMISWGDGSPVEVVHPPVGSDIVQTFHSYAADGTYAIVVNDKPNDPATPAIKLMAYMYSGDTTDLAITTTGGRMDMVLGGSGNDMLKSGIGNDWISGGSAGDDMLFGGDGSDVIFGDVGNDMVRGGNDSDFIYGGDGDDKLYGDAGFDFINGDAGNDKLYGGGDTDFMDGGDGNDKLYGDDGSDRLDGGAGMDQLTGGAGVDTFHFTAPVAAFVAPPVSERDTIMDFSSINTPGGDGDVIDVHSFADAAGVGQLTFRDYGEKFGGTAGELRVAANLAGNTLVQIDIDGDKHADFDFMVKGTTSLQANDFFL